MKLVKTLEDAKELFDYPNIKTGLMSAEVTQCAEILLEQLALLEDSINANDPRRKSEYWEEIKE